MGYQLLTASYVPGGTAEVYESLSGSASNSARSGLSAADVIFASSKLGPADPLFFCVRGLVVSEVTLGRPGSEARSGRPLPFPLRHACETASATVKMGRRRCRLAGSGFPAGFALTGIERDRASSRCAAAFLIVETQFCLRTHYLRLRVICVL